MVIKMLNRVCENPYVQYMYSYPHKTAYYSLSGINLENELVNLKGRKNSLYFHIPFCQSKCGYCNLFSIAGIGTKTKQPGYMENAGAGQMTLMERYVDAMERHARQLADIMPDGVSFSDLTLGGGTPLILSGKLLQRVFDIAHNYFGIGYGEIPVVVETSPNQTEKGKLELLKANGVTRLSIGVQSFNESELDTLHRFHSVKSVDRALGCINYIGFPCVNIDIIYGIPGQTKESLLYSLECAVSYAPEELFVYPLYIKKGTGLYKEGANRSENAMELYECAKSFLKDKGYCQKSMRRFVKVKDADDLEGSLLKEDLLNGGHMLQNDNVNLCGFDNTISVGCGGRSYIGNLHFCTPYTVGNSKCKKVLEAYIEKEDFLTVDNGYILSEDEQKRRYAVKHILFGNGILREDYSRHFNSEAEKDFQIIEEWCQKGYADITDDFITLTEKGIALSDCLGPEFISDEVWERMNKYTCIFD